MAAVQDNIFPTPIFEGSEKRIEVDFVRNGSGPTGQGLRAIGREQLDEMLSLAACCIVSARHHAAFDAYVLSESSLFVYPDKAVLKTCGTTRLLDAVPRLLDLAAAAGLAPRRCKYSRASFLFPDLQVFPLLL
jgi:S-adenosylmethionine decarboxylase proenzyme